MKRAGPENAARIAGRIASGGSDNLERSQQCHRLKREISAEDLLHVVVPDAQNLRHEPAEQPNRQSARDGLNPLRGFRKAQEELPQFKQQLHETHGSQTAHHSEDRVDPKLHGMYQTISGNMEQRLIAQQQVEYDPGRGGTNNNGAQHRRMQIAQYFFERE